MQALRAQEQALGLEEQKSNLLCSSGVSAHVSGLTREQWLCPQPCTALPHTAGGERSSREGWREVTSYLSHISWKVTSVSCGLL